MHVDLSHTPGLLYALAYWLSSTFYIHCMAVHSARAGNSASALDFLP